MEKNVQNIDDVFKTAFRLYEEAPSAAVWDKVAAVLDKEELADYKRRFTGWKRVAVLLFLLFSGLLTYDINRGGVAVQTARMAYVTLKLPAVRKPVKERLRAVQPVLHYNLEPLQLAVSKEVFIPDTLSGKGYILLHTIIPPPLKKSWSVTAFASNDWAEYKLDNDAISSREKHEPSLSVGVLIAKQLTRHIGVKTGLIYSHTAIIVDPQEMYAQKTPDGSVAYKYVTSSGYAYVKTASTNPVPGDSIKATTAQHNLHMFSVPLMLTYRFIKKKFTVSPGVGLTATVIAASNISTEVLTAANTESVTINKLDGRHTLYAGLIADMNIQYDCNDRWGLNLIPSFRYAITPITKDNAAKTFPFSYNIGGGVTYKF